MTDTTWMTRREAAAHLRVSTRQLDRLHLPRSTLGARPRYSREILDAHLQQRMHAPARREKGGLVRPPYLSPGRQQRLTTQQALDKMR